MSCVLSNVGTKPVTIISVDIINYIGGSQFGVNACAGILNPGLSCEVFANVHYGRGVIEVQGSTKGLRGQCRVKVDPMSATEDDIAASQMR